MSCAPALPKAVRAWAHAFVVLLAGCEIGVEEPTADGPTQQAPAAAAESWRPGSQRQAVPPQARVARGHLRFVEGFQAGQAQARAESKPMLVFFTATWCTYCHQMAEDAFTHPSVVSLADRFVCVLIDADREPESCRRFGVSGYPTIQFLSAQGAPISQVVGKQPGHQLMLAMQSVLQNVARSHRGDALSAR
jgi:thiol:disulfide interchange protein